MHYLLKAVEVFEAPAQARESDRRAALPFREVLSAPKTVPFVSRKICGTIATRKSTKENVLKTLSKIAAEYHVNGGI